MHGLLAPVPIIGLEPARGLGHSLDLHVEGQEAFLCPLVLALPLAKQKVILRVQNQGTASVRGRPGAAPSPLKEMTSSSSKSMVGKP